MEIVFNTRNVDCLRQLPSQCKTVRERCECIVPDLNDDVGKIAFAEAQVYLKSKDSVPHGIEVGLSADITVFYITEDSSSVQSVGMKKDFTVSFDTPDNESDAGSQVRLNLRGVQARSINPRKLAVDIAVEAELYSYANGELAVETFLPDEAPCGLETKRGECTALVVSSLEEKTFSLNEQIPVPDGVTRESRIVFASSELKCEEVQMLGTKALIKGTAKLRLAYGGEEMPCPVFSEHSLPFSVLADAGAEGREADRVILQTTALYTETVDAISGELLAEIELHGLAQISFSRFETIEYIADAYSVKCPFICCRDRLELCCGTESRRASASAADRAELHTEDGELTAQSAMLLPADGDEGMRGATAVISALLHYPDGSFGAVQKALQLECEPPSEGCSLSGAELEECVLSVSGGELLIDAGASFSFTERSMTQADTVCGAQLDEENPYDAFSAPDITVTSIRGRDMWTLAKTYRTSAAAIEELSALFPPRGDTILIPRAPR